MSDDRSAYVQDLIDRGLPIPPGEYSCAAGIVVPADYMERARAAGREPDSSGGFWLAEGVAVVTGAQGERVHLGSAHDQVPASSDLPPASGDIVLARDGYGIQYPAAHLR